MKNPLKQGFLCSLQGFGGVEAMLVPTILCFFSGWLVVEITQQGCDSLSHNGLVPKNVISCACCQCFPTTHGFWKPRYEQATRATISCVGALKNEDLKRQCKIIDTNIGDDLKTLPLVPLARYMALPQNESTRALQVFSYLAV